MYAARPLMNLKTLSFVFVFFMTIPGVVAAPEAKPTAAVCKAGLRAWSATKTGTLTFTELNDRMNVMFACADLCKKHEKQARAYLDEFYRIHAELANRAFDFITRHGLAEQFGEEENRTSTTRAQSSAGASER
jgi:hypothetical protein